MNNSTGSVIVVNYSEKFTTFLDASMISNIHFKNLGDFNTTYTNYPLTTPKIVVFESGILDIASIQKFSEIVSHELAQVGEILFIVEEGFRQYFEVSLSDFENKKFLASDITYKKIEEILTGSKSYQLKTDMEVSDVVQRKRKEKVKSKEIGRFQTRVTIDRKSTSTKISREDELLDREVHIDEEKSKELSIDSQFKYIKKEPPKRLLNNHVLLYDIGYNVYNLLKSEYTQGRKVLFIDYSDSLLLSFLVENDEELPESMLLEELYSEGMNDYEINKFFEENDLCILRNSYAMKRSVSEDEITTMIKYLIGRYGKRFETVFIVTDDLKVKWTSTLRYVILTPTMDNLMKMVNYADKELSDKLRRTYVKLDVPVANSDFNIDEKTARKYLDSLGMENSAKIIVGRVDKRDMERTYLYDILSLEAGTDIETLDALLKERRKEFK